jgi:hypothetical protein
MNENDRTSPRPSDSRCHSRIRSWMIKALNFTWDREVHVLGPPGWAFNYCVPKESGTPVIDQLSGVTVMAAYSGKVVIDPDTEDILEITSTLDLPDKFPYPECQTQGCVRRSGNWRQKILPPSAV